MQDGAGVSPACARTVAAAKQIITTSYAVKVTSKATEKSEKRAEAEVSKMNAVTLLFVIAAAHFIVGEDELDGDELPSRNWMVTAIQKFHGGLGLRVVREQLLLSIDATTMCVHTCPIPHSNWYISSVDDKGSKRALYTIGASAPDNIQWFSIIQGMTAVGKSLPFVLVIKHLSDAEMPSGEQIYALQIPGWGMWTGRSEESSTGWVVFIRGGSEGALKSLYDWYLQKIVVPSGEQIYAFG